MAPVMSKSEMLPLTKDLTVETCEDKFCQDYRGKQNTTRNGILCQAWDSQLPHKHDRTADIHFNDGLEENYCRNPTDAKIDESIWCYTSDPTQRWGFCDPIKGPLVLATIEYTIFTDSMLHQRTLRYGFFELLGNLGGLMIVIYMIL